MCLRAIPQRPNGRADADPAAEVGGAEGPTLDVSDGVVRVLHSGEDR